MPPIGYGVFRMTEHIDLYYQHRTDPDIAEVGA